MRLHTLLSPISALGVLGIVACSDVPTQPRTPRSPAPAAKSRIAASDTWTERAPLPGLIGAGGSFAGTATNAAGQSMIYVFGGHVGPGSGINVRAYDLATDTWVDKSAVVYESNANGVGTIGKLMYFSGGFIPGGALVGGVPNLYAYDPALDRLTRKADMPKATSEGVTGVMNGKLYVLPGACAGDFWPFPGYCEEEPIRDLFSYDPATDTWSTDLPPAPHFHRMGVGGVIHGKFYVAGGEGGPAGEGTADLDVYDPKTNTWTTLAPLPAPGFGIGAVLHDQLVAVIGPPSAEEQGATKTYAYDPRSDTWETKATYPRPGPSTPGARATYHGHDYLLTVGGTDYLERPLPSLLYTP